MTEILVDLYKLRHLYSGLGQFSLNFARELIRQVPENMHINFLVPHDSTFTTDGDAKVVKVNFQKRYLPFLNRDYSIWHSLNQFPSHFPNHKTKQILTVHDLNFLVEKNSGKSIQYLKRLQSNIDRADYITAISNSTRRQLENYINLRGKEIRVIYNGVAADDMKPAKKPAYVDCNKFFFSIGIFSRKKNFHVLLAMMRQFRDHKLILAGDNNSSYGRFIRSQIGSLNLNDRIITPGIISESDKYWLYHNCEAFLFPSLAEGFGMPVIEAMKSGRPVFLSKIDSLREIATDNAFYFDTLDEKEMWSQINRNLLSLKNGNRDMLKKARLYAGKFDWQVSVREYVRLYNEIASAPNSRT